MTLFRQPVTGGFKDVRQVSSDIAGEVFASDVLDMDELRELVSKPVWKSLQATIEKGAPSIPALPIPSPWP